LVGFHDGWFSVQDDHAQLCAELFDDLNDKRVLDACAAPGGKTAHLLEKFDLKHMTALDSDAERLKRVSENLARLQLLDHRVVTQATNAATWQAEQLFDSILLDAPCTATGVLRRHPDIRLLRQAGDVDQTARLQAKLLNNLWKQLKVGGELVYVTCSLLKAENEQQIAAFLARTPSAVEVQIEADWGQTRPHGRQLFPLSEGGDGFYFAKLRKV
jgi:16S rRNA (cytosine967-C5)-methyltransferase